jgi:hypothetical protein
MVSKTAVATLAAGLLTVGVLGFAVDSAVAASPATGPAASPAATNRTAPVPTKAERRAALAAKRADRLIRTGLAGKVVGVSATGGALGHGQLVIEQADGANFTFALTNRSHAFTVRGIGKGIATDVASSIPVGEVVVVRGAQVESGVWWATTVRETGFIA